MGEELRSHSWTVFDKIMLVLSIEMENSMLLKAQNFQNLFDKNLLESLLMCSFMCLGVLKCLLMPRHLHSKHFKSSSPSWH